MNSRPKTGSSGWHRNSKVHADRRKTAFNELSQGYGSGAVDYSIEQDILEDEVGFWLPRFAAYEVVTLPCTILDFSSTSARSEPSNG